MIDEYNAAVILRPDDVQATLGLLRVLRAAGKSTEAAAALDRAAARPALPPGTRVVLARALEREGKIQQAIDLLGGGFPATAPSTAPADALSLLADRDALLARLHGRLGQYDQSETIYLRLLDSSAASTQDVIDAAQVFGMDQRRDRVDAFLGRLAKTQRPSGVRLVFLGRYNEKIGAPAEALKNFTEATHAAPTWPEGWRELAAYQLRSGQLMEAAAAARQGAAANPSDPALAALDRLIPMVRDYRQPEQLHSLVEALAADPSDPGIADLLDVLVDLQNASAGPAQRIARLKEVAERHRQLIPAQEQLILELQRTRQFQDAADVAAAAMAAAPYDPAPAQLQSMIYCDSAQWPLALAAATNWRRRSGSETLPADLAIATILLHLDRPADAVSQLAPDISSAPAPGLPLSVAYAQALIAADRIPEADAALRPLLSDSRLAAEARENWMALAVAHKSADAAMAWLDQVAPLLPADSLDEHLRLADAFREAGTKFNSIPALRRSRDLLAPIASRPSADARVWGLFAEVAQDLGDYATAEKG